MTVWVVVDIGCIECGVENDTPVVGVYTTRDQAEQAVQKLLDQTNEVRAENERRGYFNTPWANPHQSGGFTSSDYQVRIQEVEVEE